MKRRKKMSPIHPGEILLEDFLKPMGISQYRLAKDLRVPPRRINEIVHGARAISADTALRLSRYFGTTDRFWLNMQARYDLEVEKDRVGDRIQKEVPVLARAS
ncbi:MAG: addiction module antidote protein, HigA family [Nitrospira sp.]|nr:MAG: addiction module antidote protein, HigA family [Nitrospira sp.]